MAEVRANNVVLHRIRITADRIEEREGNVALVSIPRRDIRRVSVVEDRTSEHPTFMFVLGLVCAAIGVLGAIILVRGEGFWRTGALCLSVAALTPVALAAAARRGTVLRIETSNGVRKLGFGRDVTAKDLAAFLDAAESEGALAIDMQLP